MVARAGSTNFFRRDDDGGWLADTTDADGILLTLRDRGVQLHNKRVAVVGCGGSGRAMAAALHHAGAQVTLVNRGLDRGAFARDLLELPFVPLSEFSGDGFATVVNATPVGRDSDEIAFSVERLQRDAVVVDLVYRDRPTELISRTRGPGRITIDGWDMLVTQAVRQYRLMTGGEIPERLVRQTLGFEEPAAVAGDD
jgi:3-dehydroquinate dehydratase/shikimate dehydrogenase